MQYHIFGRDQETDAPRFIQSFDKRANAVQATSDLVWARGLFEATMQTETGRVTYRTSRKPHTRIVNGEPCTLYRNRAYLKLEACGTVKTDTYPTDRAFQFALNRARHLRHYVNGVPHFWIIRVALTIRETNELIDGEMP